LVREHVLPVSIFVKFVQTLLFVKHSFVERQFVRRERSLFQVMFDFEKRDAIKLWIIFNLVISKSTVEMLEHILVNFLARDSEERR